MKFSVIVNKQQLIIPPDALANIKQNNPLFSYDGVPGKMLYPITIPYKENAPMLGLPSESAIVDIPVEVPCQFLIMNTWLIDGTVIITKSNGLVLEISVVCPYYDMSEELFNTNIRELDFEDVLIEDPEPQIYIDIEFTLIGALGADTITVSTGYAEYVVAVTGLEPFEDILGEFVDLIAADTAESGINATIIGGSILRLRQAEKGTLNRVFDTHNIWVTSATYTTTIDYMTWLTDWHDILAPYLETLMEAGSLYPTSKIQWPTMYNPEHYGDLNPDFTGWINNYEQGKPWINYSSGETMTGNRFTLVPCFYLLHVITQIFSQAKISVSGRGVNEERFKRILVENNYSIGKEWYDPISDIEYISFAARIVASNHLPDMTVSEFMNAYRAKFNFFFYYKPDERILDIKWREDVLTTPVRNNWNDKPHLPHPMDEFPLQSGVRFTSPIDSGDKLAGTLTAFHNSGIVQQADYLLGLGDIVITSAFTHPSMQIIAGDKRPELGASVKVPTKLGSGSGDEWLERRNSFAPSLLIYVGDAGVNDCNFATNDQLDVDGNPLGLDISLQWDEIYTLFYPKWIAFVTNSSQRRVMFGVGITDIMQLNFDEFYSHNNADWLVESWEINDIIADTVFVQIVLRKQKNFFTSSLL